MERELSNKQKFFIIGSYYRAALEIAPAVLWCVGMGIILGCANSNNLDPDNDDSTAAAITSVVLCLVALAQLLAWVMSLVLLIARSSLYSNDVPRAFKICDQAQSTLATLHNCASSMAAFVLVSEVNPVVTDEGIVSSNMLGVTLLMQGGAGLATGLAASGAVATAALPRGTTLFYSWVKAVLDLLENSCWLGVGGSLVSGNAISTMGVIVALLALVGSKVVSLIINCEYKKAASQPQPAIVPPFFGCGEEREDLEAGLTPG